MYKSDTDNQKRLAFHSLSARVGFLGAQDVFKESFLGMNKSWKDHDHV